MALQTLDQRTNDMRAACDGLARAVDKGSLGDFVKQNNKLIINYYKDVLDHVRKSFNIARWSAVGGFTLFVLSIVYVFAVDVWHLRHPSNWHAEILNTIKELANNKIPIDDKTITTLLNHNDYSVITVAALGVTSGLIVQLFAGVAFYLYQKVADQFAAFHICLERTHRYLVAYKMVEEIKANKDGTLHDLVCIMANAPMITRADIIDKNSKNVTAEQHQLLLPLNEHGASFTTKYERQADQPTIKPWNDNAGISNGRGDEP